VEAMDRALHVTPDAIRSWSTGLMSRHNWPAVTRKIVEELAAS